MSETEFSFTREQIKQIAETEILSTTEVVEKLDVSRQRLYKMVKDGLLTPIKTLERDKWFWRADVEKRLVELKELRKYLPNSMK